MISCREVLLSIIYFPERLASRITMKAYWVGSVRRSLKCRDETQQPGKIQRARKRAALTKFLQRLFPAM